MRVQIRGEGTRTAQHQSLRVRLQLPVYARSAVYPRKRIILALGLDFSQRLCGLFAGLNGGRQERRQSLDGALGRSGLHQNQSLGM